jgi:hypothetical protein
MGDGVPQVAGFRKKIVSNEDDAATDRPALSVEDAAAQRPLSPAARRALAEAAERRRAAAETPRTESPAELGGPKGPEPTRYGDWAVKGRVSDF